MASSKFAGSLPAMRRSNSARRSPDAARRFSQSARGVGASRTGLAPGRQYVVRDDEGWRIPVQRLACAGDLFLAERRAMRGLGAGLGRRAKADRRLGGDQGRAVGLLRSLDCRGDGVRIVAVDVEGVPAGRLDARDLVGRVRQGDRTVDRDRVVVPEDDQLVELEVAGQRDGFLADAFHQAAVAADHISVVVDEVVAELRVHDALGQRHADRVGDTLAERAGGGLDTAGETVFGMAGGLGAELAEALDLVDGHVLVAGQVEARVEQHRTVAGGQHETVAVRPFRVLRIVFQIAGEQDRGDVGAAHGQAGVARIRLLDGVHGKEADGVGHPVMLVARGHGSSVFGLKSASRKGRATHIRHGFGVNKMKLLRKYSSRIMISVGA